MKYLFFILILFSFSSIAQKGINYQGVATNASGLELINQNISIQASIISDSATGTIQWKETHLVTTDQFGLFNIVIGQGTSSGSGQSLSFDEINWGSGNHYLKIEMDASGGTNYTFTSTSQMMSVPYALYAENANIDYDSISNLISNNSFQTLTINSDTLSISGGNSVTLPTQVRNPTVSVNTYNNSLGSGGLSYNSSYFDQTVIDTVHVPANSKVEIMGFFSISRGRYVSFTTGSVFCKDLYNNTVDFTTSSSVGVSTSSFSYNLPGNCNSPHSKEGSFTMKRFFANATTIIVYSSCAARQSCAVGQPYCCGSFNVNSMISIESY